MKQHAVFAHALLSDTECPEVSDDIEKIISFQRLDEGEEGLGALDRVNDLGEFGNCLPGGGCLNYARDSTVSTQRGA